jgi:hypothetical protein
MFIEQFRLKQKKKLSGSLKNMPNICCNLVAWLKLSWLFYFYFYEFLILYSRKKKHLPEHGVIEMFFFSTFADLIEFPWILDSHTPPLPVRYHFNLDNFLNTPIPKNRFVFEFFFTILYWRFDKLEILLL